MCLQPVKIYNKYTQSYQFVPCGKCDECLILGANIKTGQLASYLNRFPYKMMVTLGYSNKHIPVVMPDYYEIDKDTGELIPYSKYIYRYHKGFSYIDYLEKGIIKELSQPIKFELHKPYGIDDDVTSVICYYDIQCFLKKLRKGEKKNGFKFKYFACSEYGSKHERFHTHIIFVSDSNIFGQKFKDKVVRCWCFADWDELKLHVDPESKKTCFEECFKQVEGNGVASYVSSYVNSAIGGSSFYSQRGIRSKTYRSKDPTFVVDEEISERFTKYFIYYRNVSKVRGFDESPFSFRCQDKYGNISARYLSTRILYTFCAKPKDTSKVNFRIFFSRCYTALSSYYFGKRSEVVSSDYNFVLSYKRYLKLFPRIKKHDSISVWKSFIIRVWNILKAFELDRLKRQMLEFDPYNITDYLIKLRDTAPNNSKLRYSLFANLVFNPLDKSQLRYFDNVYRSRKVIDDALGKVLTQKELSVSRAKVVRFNFRLQKKHINEYKRNKYNLNFI